jgi:hypothetical protein
VAILHGGRKRFQHVRELALHDIAIGKHPMYLCELVKSVVGKNYRLTLSATECADIYDRAFFSKPST